ncbi:MAG TPA: ATP-dependent Clp protease proteolytic subunit [Candidatus Obscuribacterales bacterium]
MAKKVRDEAALKLEQLEIAVEQAKLDLRKKRREDRRSATAAALDLKQKKLAVEKAEVDLASARRKDAQDVMAAQKSELDLASARRKDAQEKAADVEHGEYTFCEGVNWDTVKAAIADLNKLSRRKEGKPLNITINSPGGSVIAGLALYDHIRDLSNRGHHMTVKVRGMAASMGGILLQSGDTRVVGPEALVLIHEVASGTFGKVSEMTDDLNFSRKLWDKLAVILAKRSTMTDAEIKDKAHKFDWWLDADEAVRLGFADKIG